MSVRITGVTPVIDTARPVLHRPARDRPRKRSVA